MSPYSWANRYLLAQIARREMLSSITTFEEKKCFLYCRHFVLHITYLYNFGAGVLRSTRNQLTQTGLYQRVNSYRYQRVTSQCLLRVEFHRDSQELWLPSYTPPPLVFAPSLFLLSPFYFSLPLYFFFYFSLLSFSIELSLPFSFVYKKKKTKTQEERFDQFWFQFNLLLPYFLV